LLSGNSSSDGPGRPPKKGQSFVVRFRYEPGRHPPEILALLEALEAITSNDGPCDRTTLLADALDHNWQPNTKKALAPEDFDDLAYLLL